MSLSQTFSSLSLAILAFGEGEKEEKEGERGGGERKGEVEETKTNHLFLSFFL